MSEKTVKDMGPGELQEYAATGEPQHAEVTRELERRWHSFDDFLPKTEFQSILE